MENTLFFVGSVTSFLVSQVLIWKFGDPGYISTTPEDDAIVRSFRLRAILRNLGS